MNSPKSPPSDELRGPGNVVSHVGGETIDESFATLVAELAGDSDVVGDEVFATLRQRFPIYRTVDPDAQRALCRRNAKLALEGLARQQLPTAEELHGYRQYGRMRAESGVPLETTMAVHHIGLRTAWERLVSLARRRGLDRAESLPGVVNLMMAWTEALSAAAADGYTDAGHQRELATLDGGQQFTERLQTGQIGDAGIRLLARSLNFDPEREFQAIYYTDGLTQGGSPNLNRWIRAGAEAASLAVFGTTTLVVFQAISAERVLTLLAIPDAAPAGVGLTRTGLTGAVDSVIDAERALRLATRRRSVIWFERDWLTASLLPELDRLRPLLNAEATATHEHLKAAVRAFARSSFSITEAAKILHIHPNTLKYRLDRWHDLTGWDPRTLDGLQRSMLALDTG